MSKKTTLGIVNLGNDYVIAVKNNQPSLYQSIKAQAQTKPLDAHSWQPTGHGHDTRGRIKVGDANEVMMKQWAGWQR